MLIHVVVFWLKPDASPQAKDQLFSDAKTLLADIPCVRRLDVGKPAMTPRPEVDNSYDLGLCVVFDDIAGHDAYQVHELHQRFIERNKSAWQRVQVYDFL